MKKYCSKDSGKIILKGVHLKDGSIIKEIKLDYINKVIKQKYKDIEYNNVYTDKNIISISYNEIKQRDENIICLYSDFEETILDSIVIVDELIHKCIVCYEDSQYYISKNDFKYNKKDRTFDFMLCGNIYNKIFKLFDKEGYELENLGRKIDDRHFLVKNDELQDVIIKFSDDVLFKEEKYEVFNDLKLVHSETINDSCCVASNLYVFSSLGIKSSNVRKEINNIIKREQTKNININNNHSNNYLTNSYLKDISIELGNLNNNLNNKTFEVNDLTEDKIKELFKTFNSNEIELVFDKENPTKIILK